MNVAYPLRGEVIQSPSIVMGDDALLLKYLNLHIIVIATEATMKKLYFITLCWLDASSTAARPRGKSESLWGQVSLGWICLFLQMPHW